ncbi:MAG: glycosyltransferase family 117 protein [Gemmatimonadota bacterium]
MSKVIDTPAVNEYRPPYIAAAVATVAVWLLYALTLSPTTWFWDTSEYITTGHILGIPHPPGNPLFVLLARAWDVLLTPFPLSTAQRINLFSATMSALAHGCWFLLAHRILAFFSQDRWFRILGAAAATLISATAFTVWNQSNVNEKVYTVSLFTIALLSWLAFRWRDNLGRGKDDNLLILIVFILALSVGNHLMAFLAFPALLVYVLLVEPRTLLNWKLYAFSVVAVVVGLSVHMFLPLRAQLDPIINEADPTCESVGAAMTSIVTMGRAGCEELSDALARKQYDKPSMFIDPVEAGKGNYGVPRGPDLVVAQFGNYLQYFDWQWARSVAGHRNFFGGARPLFTLIFIALGIFGALQHYRRDRKSFWYLAVLFGTLSLGLTFYLNFRYGFTYPVEFGMDSREVRERDYFFIVSFSIWGVWTGIGLAALWQWLGQRIADARGEPVRERPPASAAAVLVLALIPLLFNWSWADRRHDWAARDWAVNLLNSVEPYGVLFTNGDNDTFPLWYAQEVEGIRQDVTVIVMSYLNTDWYAKQLAKLTTPCAPGQNPYADSTRIICQRPYNAEQGPRVYSDSLAKTPAAFLAAAPGQKPPTKSILPLSEAQIELIANTPPFRLQENQIFTAGNIESMIPQDEVMLPADLFLGYIVTQSIADRPIYFASTTQAFDELRLGNHILRQGLAYKLVNGPVEPDSARGIVAMPDELIGVAGPYLDVPRTATLAEHVFVHHPGFPDKWTAWVDIATQQIPLYYGYTHMALAQAYSMMGDSTAMNQHAAQMNRYFRLGNLRRGALGD